MFYFYQCGAAALEASLSAGLLACMDVSPPGGESPLLVDRMLVVKGTRHPPDDRRILWLAPLCAATWRVADLARNSCVVILRHKEALFNVGP